MTKLLRLALLSLILAFACPAEARSPYAGRYRVAEGPDVAGGLELGADGHFRYFLSAGALDQHADGTWTETGGDIRLTTDPRPVPPSFARGPDAMPEAGKDAPTIHVRLADGRDLAGVDFRIGLTTGASMAGYTQAEGWSFEEQGEKRIVWVELVEPIYDVASPRFIIDPPAAGGLVFVLTPNDIEVVDFRNDRFEKRSDDFVLHLGERTLRMVRAK
ncbi:hypothetical protein [Novosphingobium sp. Gsoil 351]|uniref:hypothetical protein n=1 Tax=Novosphingobium sp. Gsoil 351 TaxID=2675225 RepID=UPI0012B4586C|nr:hypothetical protein [Novosphingobium sp. Gsoil 351]QGN54730.1 hypothetical protein GKE62_09360 [Novosphingobium sp. Gsoil 351]